MPKKPNGHLPILVECQNCYFRFWIIPVVEKEGEGFIYKAKCPQCKKNLVLK